jgi:hypothetical protein
LIEHAQKNGDVVLTSIGVNSPYVFVREYSQEEYIAILRELVEEYDIAFCDIYDRFGGNFDAALANHYLADNITHPNILGHTVTGDSIKRIIIPIYLRRVPSLNRIFVSRSII